MRARGAWAGSLLVMCAAVFAFDGGVALELCWGGGLQCTQYGGFLRLTGGTRMFTKPLFPELPESTLESLSEKCMQLPRCKRQLLLHPNARQHQNPHPSNHSVHCHGAKAAYCLVGGRHKLIRGSRLPICKVYRVPLHRMPVCTVPNVHAHGAHGQWPCMWPCPQLSCSFCEQSAHAHGGHARSAHAPDFILVCSSLDVRFSPVQGSTNWICKPSKANLGRAQPKIGETTTAIEL